MVCKTTSIICGFTAMTMICEPCTSAALLSVTSDAEAPPHGDALFRVDVTGPHLMRAVQLRHQPAFHQRRRHVAGAHQADPIPCLRMPPHCRPPFGCPCPLHCSSCRCPPTGPMRSSNFTTNAGCWRSVSTNQNSRPEKCVHPAVHFVSGRNSTASVSRVRVRYRGRPIRHVLSKCGFYSGYPRSRSPDWASAELAVTGSGWPSPFWYRLARPRLQDAVRAVACAHGAAVWQARETVAEHADRLAATHGR